MTLAQKEQAGKILIWIGVLAWLPYIIARLLGNDISAIPFLILHLIGVVGGLILRNQASKGQAPPSKRIIRLKNISTILLFTGISVWLVYFLLGLVQDQALEIRPFLIVHLFFVLTGASIKLYIFSSRK